MGWCAAQPISALTTSPMAAADLDLDNEDVQGVDGGFFEEAAEVDSIIQGVVERVNAGGQDAGLSYDRFKAIVSAPRTHATSARACLVQMQSVGRCACWAQHACWRQR